MRPFKHCAIFGLSCVITLALTACSPSTQKPRASVDPIRPTLVGELREGGVQVVQQGSRLQLILPTDKFFRAQTTELKDEQTNTLERVALYLKYFLQNHDTNSAITVTGYTDTIYTKKQRQQLSQQYATVIASYLWNQGFSQHQLHVAGQGSSHPVASTKTAVGSSYNRRVVIQVNPLS